MGDLTRNLSHSEFACKCGKPCVAKEFDFKPLAIELQHFVDHFADVLIARIKIEITSGGRCREHNAASGGAKDSKHIEGIAADFKLFQMIGGEWKQIPTKTIHDYLCTIYPTSKGIIKYKTWNHFDLRKTAYHAVTS